MRYNTPELLLVGAAQHLVLEQGTPVSVDPTNCILDQDATPAESDFVELW
jgi:hypothetical protein